MFNTQEEDQEGTSAKRRDQDGSEGSNAPTGQEKRIQVVRPP